MVLAFAGSFSEDFGLLGENILYLLFSLAFFHALKPQFVLALAKINKIFFLMKQQGIKSLQIRKIEPIEENNQQAVFMGATLVGLNLILMLFVSLYWTNPWMHQQLSGTPLVG